MRFYPHNCKHRDGRDGRNSLASMAPPARSSSPPASSTDAPDRAPSKHAERYANPPTAERYGHVLKLAFHLLEQVLHFESTKRYTPRKVLYHQFLDEAGADWAVLDVGGVGYLVHCSAKTLAAIGVAGDEATLFTDLQVSENDMRLLGFASGTERDWFRLLTQVQGVGSKVALAILSALAPDELRDACSRGDAATVARAQGVGPKLAARIVNELKDKAGAIVVASGPGMVAPIAAMPGNDAVRDALSALGNLGFRPAEAARAVAEAHGELGEGAGFGDLVRVALKKSAH